MLVLDYLYTNTNKKNIIKFTLEDMINECGYKLDIHKNRTNDQFKVILSKLHIAKKINSSVEFKRIKPKDLVSCTYLINLDSSFVMLYEWEKNIILKQTIVSCDNLKLLTYYCYLKCRMYKRSAEDSMEKNGGRPEITFPSYEIISKDLGLTDETIKKYNDLLVKLNLIRIGSAGNFYYKDDKNKMLRESSNIYTLLIDGDEIRAKTNLKEGIKYYKELENNSNKVFTNSKAYKNNKRQLNGKLGAIIKKENLGTATEEDLKMKNEILASINADSVQFKIKALLDANKGEILSDIYSDLNKEVISDKYYKLELELDLIDWIGELLVDWDYYCYIMTNYNKNDHEKYINYIKKHKRDKENNEKLEELL